MGKTVEELKVIIGADASGLTKESNKAVNQAKKMVNSIQKSIKEAKQPIEMVDTNELGGQLRNVKNMIQKTLADAKNGELTDALSYGVKNYAKEAQLASGIKVYTDDYKKICGDIERTENALGKLQQKKQVMESEGTSKESKAWQAVTHKIASAERQLESYKATKYRMEGTGQDVKFSAGQANQSWINSAGAVAGSAFSSVTQRAKEFGASVSEAVGKIPVIGRVSKEASYVGKKAFQGMSAVLKKISPVIKSAGGAFASLIKRFSNGIPFLNRTKKAASGMGGSMRGLGGIFRTIGMSARFMFASFLLQGTISGVREGLQNLSKYSSSTNASLSMLKSSLTQLKNALAVAFAPILDYIAPALNTLIQMAITAANALGQLFSALTGKSYAVQAVKVNQDYASSLGNSASKANDAADANEKLKKSLMGFDQINKLDDNSSSGSGGSGGGSGGGVGIGAGSMFETVEIDSGISGLADAIKEAWQKADFTDLGVMVGEKLNAALESIPWDKIKETSRKIAKSIATFLNGFIEATDWKLVGSTFAEGLNTGIEFGYTFVNTFEWKKFGQAISDSINGVIGTLDFTKAGKTFSDSVKGILDTMITAVENTDWRLLGEKIKDCLVNIDWSGIVSRIGELIGAAAGGLAAFIGGLLGDAFANAQSYFSDKIEECGNNTVLGILKGIADALAGIGQWIIKNVFTPIIDGFKSAFGIHSPSTVMKEQGGYLISGLLEGLKDNLKSIIDWFKDLPNKITGAIGKMEEVIKVGVSLAKSGWKSLEDFVGDKVKAAISLAKSGWKSLEGFVGDKISASVKLAKSGWSSITSFVGTSVKVGIKLGKSGWSSIKKWLGIAKSLVLKFKLPRIKVNWGSKKVAGFTIKYPNGFSTYAKGGFPAKGQMFIANEAGPEMVGTMDGKNAVANNNQITAGIAAAVYPAVYNAIIAAFARNGGNGNPSISIYIGDKQVTDYFVEYIKSQTKSTGNNPILI